MIDLFKDIVGIKAKTFSVKINNKTKKYSVDNLCMFLMGGYANYDLTDPNLVINGVKKDEFFYSLKKFIMHYNLRTQAFFFDSVNMFIDDVLNDKYANTVQYSFSKVTKDDNLDDVVLNQKLIDCILDGMPSNYSEAQKATYIYIKLCKVLSYDPEFYASNQRGMIARSHQDIERLANITPKNNQIVCYEFTQIFAKFLNMLNITYVVSGSGEYGSMHNSLVFKVNDFIVKADSVSSIIGGDLFNAKVNKNLVGLVCKNKNTNTKNKFSSIINQVYHDIVKYEPQTEAEESSFENFLSMFGDWCETEDIDISTKVQIFKKQAQKVELPAMEKISYMRRLAKVVFAEEKLNKQFDVCIISQKVISGLSIKNMPALIFSYCEDGFKYNEFAIKYKLVDEKGNITDLTYDEINRKFDEGKFKHITSGVNVRHTIPGVDIEEDEDVK